MTMTVTMTTQEQVAYAAIVSAGYVVSPHGTLYSLYSRLPKRGLRAHLAIDTMAELANIVVDLETSTIQSLANPKG